MARCKANSVIITKQLMTNNHENAHIDVNHLMFANLSCNHLNPPLIAGLFSERLSVVSSENVYDYKLKYIHSNYHRQRQTTMLVIRFFFFLEQIIMVNNVK